MKPLEAWNKLDHTLCLNSPAFIFNIDDERLYGTEFAGEYDPNNTDCKSMDEMVDCMNVIEKTLKAFEIIKKKGLTKNEIFMIKMSYPYNEFKETTTDLYGVGYSEYSLLLKTKEEYELLKEVLK